MRSRTHLPLARPSLPRLAVVALTALALSPPARAAQPPQLDAAISADQIGLDETLRLTVTVARDASQTYQSYVRPEPKDFDVLSSGESESTQWTLVNGVQSTRTIEQHTYILRPRHKGSCTIPAATARIDGRELRTREFVVRVTPRSQKPKNAANGPAATAPPGAIIDPFGNLIAPGGVAEPEGMRGDEDVFVEARADKSQAFVGEQVLLTWKLYARAEILRYRATQEPRNDDFWVEELYAPPGKLSWERAVVKGQEYEAATLLKRALFPLHAGKLTVTPLEAEVTTLQTAFYAGGSATRKSQPITLDVLPLPAQGRPAGFEPTNVGQFDVVASADNTMPKAGEAITYRVLLKGRGNLKNVRVPRFEQIDGFKVYEPTVTDAIQRNDGGVEGMKIIAYLLLPRKGGELHIPPFAFHYFDPADRKYKDATAPDIKITVSGDPGKIGAAQQETKENVLKPRIRPLRIKRHVESHLGEALWKGRALPFALGLPPALLALVMGAGWTRERLARETAGSRRRRARATARRHLRAAEAHLKAQRPSQFFAECARSIYDQLEFRLGEKCEACTMDELKRLLRSRGMDEVLAGEVVQELEQSDFARFAASASGPAEMRAALRRVRHLLGEVERARLSRAARGGAFA